MSALFKKNIFLYLIFVLISFFSLSCGYIKNKAVYFSDLSVSFSKEDNYLLKRYIFFSYILKNESRVNKADLRKASVIYTGRSIFISAPRYLPETVRNIYKNEANSLYQNLFYRSDYKSELKYTFFDCYGESENVFKEASSMKEGDIAVIESYDGYTIFMLASKSERSKGYMKSDIYREKVENEKYLYNEKRYMDKIYYSQYAVRNYSSLLNLDSKEDVLIASYKTNEIRISSFASKTQYREAYIDVLNARSYEEKVRIFEELVFRPFVEKFYFNSLPLYTNPVYNMYRTYGFMHKN